jgi:hypothetical protein
VIAQLRRARMKNRGSIPGSDKRFLFPEEPSVQCLSNSLSSGINHAGSEADILPYPGSKFRINGSPHVHFPAPSYLKGDILDFLHNLFLNALKSSKTTSVRNNARKTRSFEVTCLQNRGLFEMVVGVLTTCHTQYISDSSVCIFSFNL